MNKKLFPYLRESIDILSQRQFSELQGAVAWSFFQAGDHNYRFQESNQEKLEQLRDIVYEFAEVYTAGTQHMKLTKVADGLLVYYRECKRVADLIIATEPEVPDLRRYYSGDVYRSALANKVYSIITGNDRLKADDLTWLCPFRDELDKLQTERNRLRGSLDSDETPALVAAGLPEEVQRDWGSYDRNDPAHRKHDVKAARESLDHACGELSRAIYLLDNAYASAWRNFLTLRQAENALPGAEASLTKPLEYYAWDWRKHQYKHQMAQVVHQLQEKVKANEAAREPKAVRETNREIAPSHVERLANETAVAHAFYQGVLTNTRTILAHEQTKATASKKSQNKARREKAQEPVVVPAEETDEGIKVDPVKMRRGLQGRSGFVVILGTAVAVSLVKNWLAELERNASGSVARDWEKMADSYQVWFKGTGETNQPITAVAKIQGVSYGSMKVQATFKPQEVPGDELEFVNHILFEGVDQ